MRNYTEMYATRKLAEGYPGIEDDAQRVFVESLAPLAMQKSRLERLLKYVGRLIDLERQKNILVLGCGPKPHTGHILTERGFNVVNVEPVPSFVESAREYLGFNQMVLQGAAEYIPVESASQNFVFFESVLEHVDSIPHSLNEIYRVLEPGGILYLSTTNRHHFSINGHNGEFNVPFYNWLPKLVKESYVFQHLHYNPKLANYTERPAVHWLSYSDLCRHGRDAGFAQFYSIVDLMQIEDPSIKKSWIRRVFLPLIQRNPWLRSLALTQVGHVIFMLKRR